jgi:hypothetical protein
MKKVWLNNRIVDYLVFMFENSKADAFFSQDYAMLNTGFFAVKSTKFSIQLFSDLIITQSQNPKIIEQLLFDKLIRKLTLLNYKDSKIIGLDPLLFANGDIFFHKKINKKLHIKPFTVHVNYIAGEKNKMDALKYNKFWYI